MNDTKLSMFSPITIGKRTLRNRIVFLPHATGQGIDWVPTQGHAAYFERRALGGVGMIVQESTPVHPASLARLTHVKGYDKAVIGPARRVSEAVHNAGAVMLVQISHRGLAALPLISGMPVWAPSPSRSPHTGEVAHAVTLSEIKETIAGFVQTARNFMEGGYDGVEIHATHGHLLNSFVSPRLNWRRDAYGGSAANRYRLVIEVLQALRGLPIGILGIRFGAPAWNTGPEAEDAAAAIKAIEPYVDYISVTGGTQATKHLNMGDMYSQPGYMVAMARQVKQHTSKPVIAAGRLHDPALAASVIDAGAADLVGMARALICDPDWVSKAAHNATESIRPCIACNTCLERVDSGAPIGCIHNPRTGREAELTLRHARLPHGGKKKVRVIGGGPAGMQAALRAAELEWDVTLTESATALGGQLAVAAAVPGREIFERVTSFLKKGIAASGIRVETGMRVEPGASASAGFHGVIVATGAAFVPTAKNAAIEIPCARAEDVLCNPRARRGQRVLVVVDDELPASGGAAEVLVNHDGEVHMVLAGAEVGSALPVTNRQNLMGRLYELPLRWHLYSTLKSVSPEGAAVIETKGMGEMRLAGAFNCVVYGTARAANVDLIEYFETQPSVRFASAGDCVAPRGVYSAVREGYDAADRLAALFVS